MKRIEGQIVDVLNRDIFSGSIDIENGKIVAVNRHATAEKRYIMPGFVDAHIHIESSMLAPREYARMAMKHGTISIVTDPHEIANVCGVDGVRYMMDESDRTPLKICFAVPSCVPATALCPSGAVIDSKQVAELLKDPHVYALAEMMDYVGVINHDAECAAKLAAAHKVGKPVDGHIPCITGEELARYVKEGISTDHEVNNLLEGKEKISLGMKVLLRRGSAARNFDALHTLIIKRADNLMFCTDDQKAYDLQQGHINKMVASAVQLGYDLFDVLRIASVNPVRHYRLPVGLLQEGDPADFVICKSLTTFDIEETYINGEPTSQLGYQPAASIINHFKAQPITVEQIAHDLSQCDELHVIQVKDGELITPHLVLKKGEWQRIQKIVVVNRYQEKPSIGVGYLRDFHIGHGAMAQSIAHDSHHIIATGSSDELIVKAVNRLIELQGGIVVVDEQSETTLPLPIGGLMSNEPAEVVAEKQISLIQHLRRLNCRLSSPLIALAFLQLVVIPELKITDKGLFDVVKFKYI